MSRHIHISLRDSSGRNSFAVSDSELKSGRNGAAFDDTMFVSLEAEWFLAGLLDGIGDGMYAPFLCAPMATKQP